MKQKFKKTIQVQVQIQNQISSCYHEVKNNLEHWRGNYVIPFTEIIFL